MKLLLIDTKEMNLFFQADIEDNEELSELVKDDRMTEIQRKMEEVKKHHKKLLKQKEIIKLGLEELIKDVNEFNERHNKGYQSKEVRVQI